jgi:hypothetical protein
MDAQIYLAAFWETRAVEVTNPGLVHVLRSSPLPIEPEQGARRGDRACNDCSTVDDLAFNAVLEASPRFAIS